MIYIITPYLSDFKLICKEKDYKTITSASDDKIKWIYNWMQLAGRKIFKADIIIYGDKCKYFFKEEINKINVEIAIRKKI